MRSLSVLLSFAFFVNTIVVLQYNPPFTLPFNRRNEVALEVERREISS